MIEITTPRPHDATALEALLDRAFGPGRLKKRSYDYRKEGAPIASLCFVAREDGAVVGSIAYWPVRIGASMPALLLGPLAVEPSRKHCGIGSALMDHSLTCAAAAGHGIVVLVGDPEYYARFGFSSASAVGILMPGEQPERLRIRELRPGALVGVSGDIRPVAATSEAA